MTDAELLEAYRATHDRQVLNGLFARHYPIVYHVVLKLVRNGSDASDLTQSTFLKALESAESVRSTGSLRNWLLTIAINEVRQFRRGAARRNRPEALGALARKGLVEPPQDADLLRREFEDQLELALQQFPDDLKDPLVLHYYQNLSYAEIAQILGIPKSSVQFRMEQALEKLRGQLRKRELLALIPVFVPRKRFGKILGWGATIMNVKILAYSAVLLCALLVTGGMVWRSTRPGRPAADSEGLRSAASKAGAAKASVAAAADPRNEGIGIFGRVVERDTDLPLAGATISAYDFETGTTDQTVSDENGVFRLASGQGNSRTQHLRIKRNGYAPASLSSVTAASQPLLVRLSGGGSLKGRVEDSHGIPIYPYQLAVVRQQRIANTPDDNNQLLYLRSLPNEWIVEEAETVLRSDGSFDIRHLNPGFYVLVVTAPGSCPCTLPASPFPSEKDQIEVTEGSTREVRIVRPPLGKVRVRVLDRETREPIPGANVAAVARADTYYLPLDGPSALTDARGICELPALLRADGKVSDVELWASKEGYATGRVSGSGQEDETLFEAELPRPARIRGTVRAADGKPVERAAVYLEHVSYHGVKLAFTNADGSYAFAGLQGPCSYVVYVHDRSMKSPRTMRSVTLRAGETREVDFGAASEGGLSGKVTRRGKPCPSARLCIDGPGGRDRHFVFTNEQGLYGIDGLAAGTYDIMANTSMAAGDFTLERRIALGDGERKQLDFEAGGLRIRGMAVDAATLAPLLGQYVEIVARRVDGDAAADRVTTRPRADGRFELEVSRPGIYQLTTDNQYGSDFFDINTPQVDLTETSSVDDVQMLLQRDLRDGKIALTIVDSSTGAPIPEGMYHVRNGTCGGAGYFEGATILEQEARIGTHKFKVFPEEYVPFEISVDITWTTRRAEASVKLVRSEAIRITMVFPSSPAEKAGLQEGDLLVSYDGAALKNLGTLKAAARGTPFSQKVALEIRRGGESRVLVVPGQPLGILGENALLR